MQRLFITGIPTSGKSYLAKKLAQETGGTAVLLDDFRESLASEGAYAKWVNFYLDQDEEKYYTKTSPDQQWSNLVKQSEALWPAFLEKIQSYAREEKPVIFECVNILPHLAKKDLDFPGVVLLGASYEEVSRRNKEEPRWGDSDRLQELEARSFFFVERPHYKEEADKHGYAFFETADEAKETALNLLTSNRS